MEKAREVLAELENVRNMLSAEIRKLEREVASFSGGPAIADELLTSISLIAKLHDDVVLTRRGVTRACQAFQEHRDEDRVSQELQTELRTNQLDPGKLSRRLAVIQSGLDRAVKRERAR